MAKNVRVKSEGLAEAPPHYYGHFRAIPQRDVKPLAKELIAKFGSFAEVVAAPAKRLAEVKDIGESVITELKIVHAAASRLARGEVKGRLVLASWSAVLDYCRTAMTFADKVSRCLKLLRVRISLD
jgi:DNA repair protein RadC